MTEKNGETAAISNREMTATRVFDAPRELVFQMGTDANHTVQTGGSR